MYTVYVIKSLVKKYIYVGITDNLDRRIREHNQGKSSATSIYRPFELVFSENCATRQEARNREKYFKSGRGKSLVKRHIED